MKAPDLIRIIVSDPSAPFLICTPAGLLPKKEETGDCENDAILSQKVTGERGYSSPVRNVSVKGFVLFAVCPYYPRYFRIHVSRKAAGKGRAVLEGVGLDSATIAACYTKNPQDEEAIVQEGLTRWTGGHGTQPPTWGVLFKAMENAKMTVQTRQPCEGDS